MSSLACYIRNLGGDVFTVPLVPSMTVNELKYYLCSTPNPFPIQYECEVCLIMESTPDNYIEIVGDTMLAAYGVTHATTLHIVINRVAPGTLLRTYEREVNSIGTPSDICIHNDELFVVLEHRHIIQVMRARDGKFLRYYGTGLKGSGPADFSFPTSICISAKGELFVADSENYRIKVIDASTGAYLRSYYTYGKQAGDVIHTARICLSPTKDELFVAAFYNHCVYVLKASTGEYLRSYGGDEEEGQEKKYRYPRNVYVTEDDKLYIIADDKVHVVKASDGTVLSIHASPIFNNLSSIYVSRGIMFISESSHHCVMMIRESNSELLYIYGKNPLLTSPYPNKRFDADFDYPGGMIVSDKNELYVADTYNDRIQVFHIPEVPDVPEVPEVLEINPMEEMM